MIAITTRSAISVKPWRLAPHVRLHPPERQLPVHRAVVRDERAGCSLDRISAEGGEPPGSGPALADPVDVVLSPVDSSSSVTKVVASAAQLVCAFAFPDNCEAM
jgi:hypothetical protein